MRETVCLKCLKINHQYLTTNSTDKFICLVGQREELSCTWIDMGLNGFME